MRDMQSVATVEPAPHASTADAHIDAGRWYSAREAARLLGCSVRSIQRAHAIGRLKGAPINDRGDLRFSGGWILGWLEDAARAD